MATASRTMRILSTQLSTQTARLPARPRQLSMQARGLSTTCGRPGWAPQRWGQGLAAPAAAGVRRPHLGPSRLHVRCLASKDDKSWSDIASEAAQLGKDLVKKVGNSVGKAVAAIVPSSEREEERPLRRERERERERRDMYRPEDALFGGGLVGRMMGKAVGSMLRSAAGALGEQMRQAAEQVADVQERAARIIEGNSRVRSRLGGSLRVLPPVSQSSMSQSINGRSSRTITLILPVVGASGATAQAQVQYVEGESSAEELKVAVRLPSGEVVHLDGGSSPAAQTIDVEWRSVDDK